jgi:hypothetical protein
MYLSIHGSQLVGGRETPDGVYQGHALVSQQRMDTSEELYVLRPTNVLEHADADDGVEFFAGLGEAFAIVLQVEFDLLLQTALAGTLAGDFELLLREGDADAVRAMALGQVHGQTSPSTADIEHARPRPQVELGGDMFAFGLLCRFQRIVRVAKVGAGVMQVPVEETPIDRIIDVVVMADIGLRAPACIAFVHAGAHPPIPAGGGKVRLQCVEIADAYLQHFGQVVIRWLPVTVHIGLGEGDGWIAQHAPEHGGAAQADRGDGFSTAQPPAAAFGCDQLHGALAAAASNKVE